MMEEIHGQISNFGLASAGIWVKFFNDMDGVAINTGNVATTSNGGNSWQAIPASNIPAFLPGEFNTGIKRKQFMC